MCVLNCICFIFVTGYAYALTKNCVGGEAIEDE